LPDSATTFGDSLTRFLGYESIRTSEESASSWVTTRPDLVLNGELHMIALAFLVDSTPGVVCGAAALPDWVVTTDLHAHLVDPRIVGRARADATLVRAGRAGVLAEVTVRDEGDGDRVLAVGSVNHSRVPLTGTLDVPQMPVGVRYSSPAVEDAGDRLVREVRFEHSADGTSSHSLSELTTNPLGLLHGSVTTTLAADAAVGRVGPGWRVSDVMMRFIGGVRKGPATAVPHVVAQSDRQASVEVRIYDQSKPDRLASIGWLGLARR
jgi:acyl-coenzyme A thioesterase PaaI-like protein